jgi:hypothetical protein
MSSFQYRRASMSVKILASGFLTLALVGLGVVLLQIYVKTGLTAHGVLAHYRGDEATFQTAMGFGELVEITHAHAFTMPLLALSLGLAFVLTEASERVKRTVVTALLAGVALELGLPWVVRYGPAWTVHLFNVAGFLLAGGIFAAVGVPLYEMWIVDRRLTGPRP